MTVVGRTVQAAGQLVTGVQGYRAGEFNAQQAERQAEITGAQTEQQIAANRRRGEALRGRQRALFARAGVAVEGSPLSVLADTAAEEELAVQNLRFGQAITRGRLQDRAEMARLRGSMALVEGVTGAAGTALGGFATARQFGLGGGGDTTTDIDVTGGGTRIPDSQFIGAT